MEEKKTATSLPGTPAIVARCRYALDCSSNARLAEKLDVPVYYLEELEKGNDAIGLLFCKAVREYFVNPLYLLLGIGKVFLNDIESVEEFFNDGE